MAVWARSAAAGFGIVCSVLIANAAAAGGIEGVYTVEGQNPGQPMAHELQYQVAVLKPAQPKSFSLAPLNGERAGERGNG